MTTLEVLRATRELLSDETRWARGNHAYDSEGNIVDPNASTAERFCVLGAMWYVSNSGQAFMIAEALAGRASKLAAFNDTGGYRKIMQWLDTHIAALEKMIEIAKQEEMTEGAPLEPLPVEQRELVPA